jgi:hypothetical protein
MKCFRLLAVIGLCACLPAARAATLEEFNVQGWIVGAYSDNRTGLFTHCATSVPFRSGTTLLFHLSRSYRWSMGLHNPAWRSRPGAAINLMYYIDNEPPIRVTAVVNNLGVVNVPLADSRALFEKFKKGRRLFVVDAREKFGFDLANSSKALEAVYSCVQRHSAGSNPPPGYDRGPPPGYDRGPPPGYDRGPPPNYDRGPPPGYDRPPPGPAPGPPSGPPPVRPPDQPKGKGGAETSL